MTATAETAWQEDNRLHLAAVLDDLLARLMGEPTPSSDDAADAIRATMTAEPALVRLADLFDLDRFGVEVVAWCAGWELDARYRDGAGRPTVGRALAQLRDPSWRALHPTSPLRRWGLIDVDAQGPFVDAPLRLAGDVLLYLLGLPPGPGRGSPLVAGSLTVPAPPSQHDLAESIAESLAGAGRGSDRRPGVALHGGTSGQRRLLAQLCAARLGADLMRLDLRDLPPVGPALDAVLIDCHRLARLTGGLLLVEAAEGGGGDDQSAGAGTLSPPLDDCLRQTLALAEGVVFVSSDRPAMIDPSRPLVRREVDRPSPRECLELWQVGLGRDRDRDHGEVEPWLTQLAFQFRLDSPSIAAVCDEALSADGAGPVEDRLRAGCRRLARMQLDPVADRVAVDGDVEVVLPAIQQQQLDELEAQIRLSYQVTTEWGIGGARAPGVAALFAGPSGTGKTLAAGAIARHLGLDLYRVDLATVMSKYIGETEKNLRRIFDAAETGGAILLFDEADALFGKRSDVKDSHDRYANISTAYLLQKMEQAVTPTILTTNTKEAIDPAFARRLRFVVDFPFPDQQAREQIWRSVFPAQTPTTGIDPARLATLAVNGGTIRKIALRAAYLAAGEGGAVAMPHLLESSRRELRQAGRPVPPEDVAAWL